MGSISGCIAADKVTVSGSSTVMPLAELAAEEFNLMQDEYHVSVTSGGTGVGIIDVTGDHGKISTNGTIVKH